jgi:hypothetical protein
MQLHVFAAKAFGRRLWLTQTVGKADRTLTAAAFAACSSRLLVSNGSCCFMQVACSAEIQVLCDPGNVVPGHARVLRCLQNHLESAAMGQACQQEVRQQTARAVTDFRCPHR